jgi:hypothetical protein
MKKTDPLTDALQVAQLHGLQPSRLAEQRNEEEQRDERGRLVRRRPTEPDWRERALAWLSDCEARTATIREYAAHAGLRRATAYARMLALVEDGLVEVVQPGVYRRL